MPLQLFSSGSNARGQLGHSFNEDSSTFQPCQFHKDGEGVSSSLPSRTSRILDVATGANHTVVLLEFASSDRPGSLSREIWGCGDGRAGQLGDSGSHNAMDGFWRLDVRLEEEGLRGSQVKMIAAGWETTYVVLSPPLVDADGEVQPQQEGDIIVSMGADDWGDLGIGGKIAREKTGKSKGQRTTRGLNRVTLDHILVGNTPLTSFGALTVESISAKQHHVVVLLRAETVGKRWLVGWGAARHGQLSPLLPSASSSNTTSQKFAAIVDRPQLMHEEDLGDPNVASFCVGSQHTVVLNVSGKLDGVGSNRKAQLDFSTWTDIRVVDCTWNSTFAVISGVLHGSAIRATGSNTNGQLGCGIAATSSDIAEDAVKYGHLEFPAALRNIEFIKLACGSEHVLTLWGTPSNDFRPEVWSWGWNEHGNLGNGTTEDAYIPMKIYPSSKGDWDVVDIWAGSGTSWLCCNTSNGV